MEKNKFLEILTSKTGDELFTFISSFGKKKSDIETYIKQYDPNKHDIFDTIKRKDREVFVPTNERDIEGNLLLFPDGTPRTRKDFVEVTRIAIAVQQEVTENAAAILCTNKVELVSKTDSANAIKDVWDANKLDFKNLNICNIWLSETEVAELWYYNEAKELKSIILANSLGNRLFPVFDDLGKLICFARTYVSQVWDDTDKELEDVTYCEIYTDTDVMVGNNLNEVWQFGPFTKHGFNKIPVIYASREKPLWANVQNAIERTETTISNLCDTNDYFGSPILAAIGGVLTFAAKGEPGKLIEVNEGGDLKYVTWDQAPESIKLEIELLAKIVSDDCKYVNMSAENLKGLFGTAPSSYAVRLLFTPAHQLAAKNEEIFGEYIQRRINFLLSAEGKETDIISPKFTYLLPRNDQEEITNINTAKSGGFLSTESAITDSPLTTDAEKEIKLVTNEVADKQAKDLAKAQAAAQAQAQASKQFAPVVN
jgi:hypothetical protein